MVVWVLVLKTGKLFGILNLLQHHELDFKLPIFAKLRVDNLKVEVVQIW